jgi:hypothetical protein
MIKRVEKMPEEKKMEMMSKMMKSDSITTCNDIMSKMSAIMMNDSITKSAMAAEMMPFCIGNIIAGEEENRRAGILLEITGNIIYSGYDSLPDADKIRYKEELQNLILQLD